MNLSKPDIFTFGEAMALFMSTDTDNVKTAHQYQLSAAGAEGNVAVAATRLGLDVYFQTIFRTSMRMVKTKIRMKIMMMKTSYI